jgi:ATP-dependent protease ClpP protease subunit
MSAATFILAAGDERIMGSNSWVMIHETSDWIRGSLSEMKNELKHIETLENQMNLLYERLSKGKTKAKTFEKLCARDCYLTAEETLKLGLIDRILS